METVNTYKLGIEALDEFNLPIKHMEYEETFDIYTALSIYTSWNIEKDKTAKYLLAEGWDGHQIVLKQEGYKYGK